MEGTTLNLRTLVAESPKRQDVDPALIRTTQQGLELYINPTGIPPTAIRAIKRGELEKRFLRELQINVKVSLSEREPQEADWESLHPQHWAALRGFFEKFGMPGEKFAIPISPPVTAALQAIFAGTHPGIPGWGADSRGLPYFITTAGKDKRQIIITFEALPETRDVLLAVWQAVEGLSVETADVLLVILEGITRQSDPREPVLITCDDIAKARGVRCRQGTSRTLREDLQNEVLRLKALRLRMTWRDYRRGGTITFGTEAHPDRLIDLVEVQYEKDGKTWNAFTVRAGQALAYFLSREEGVRWVGYCSRTLLQLDPYRKALTKKLGLYLIMNGVIAAKKGDCVYATPATILSYCGVRPDYGRPGRTIDNFITELSGLVEIGVLAGLPGGLEPVDRGKGHFRRWLRTPIRFMLHPALWKTNQKKLPPAHKLITQDPESGT